MIIVTHRTNLLNELKTNSTKYGCEIDIRNHNDKLLLVHDPFIYNTIELQKWLKSFNHKFLIINVKEEGLEDKLITIMKKFNIKNYFILDETLPYIYKYANLGFKKFALRVSEIEHYSSVELIYKNLVKKNRKINWIWADTFSGLPLKYTIYKNLKKLNFNICFVSPELHHQNNPKIWEKKILKYYKNLLKNKIKPDMICTKMPDLWKSLRKQLLNLHHL